MNKLHVRIRLLFFAGTVCATSAAQVAQSHPEFCGHPDTFIPIPNGIRWAPPPNRDSLNSTLFVTNPDGERRIDLEVWPLIEQICPVQGNQLVLFGDPGDGNYSVARIDLKTAVLIDGFAGRNPTMSPDQHWLIMRPYRHFRSERSSSEEYLFYDLTADAGKNKMEGLTVWTQDLVGRPVYPVPHDGVPFEFEDQPPELTHTFRSDAFYWAPDSSAVAFADSVMDKLSMVVVQIEPKGPVTLVLPVGLSGICEPQVGDNAEYPVPTLGGVDFGSSGSLVVHFGANNFCKSAQMTLRLADFRAPAPEVHTPPKRRSTGTADGVPFEQK